MEKQPLGEWKVVSVGSRSVLTSLGDKFIVICQRCNIGQSKEQKQSALC